VSVKGLAVVQETLGGFQGFSRWSDDTFRCPLHARNAVGQRPAEPIPGAAAASPSGAVPVPSPRSAGNRDITGRIW
jgi:hypothetical protein